MFKFLFARLYKKVLEVNQNTELNKRKQQANRQSLIKEIDLINEFFTDGAIDPEQAVNLKREVFEFHRSQIRKLQAEETRLTEEAFDLLKEETDLMDLTRGVKEDLNAL